jgi:Protein of unknown function (DUF935)/phage-Barnase-EndoU-ColicinE5/D-RelE like nuclease2/Phage Mu protein F like protein
MQQQLIIAPKWLNRVPILKNYIQAVGTTLTKSEVGNIVKISQEYKDRSLKDVRHWQDGVAASEHPEKPRWTLLQDTYDYLEADSQLGISKELRVAATLSRRFHIIDERTGLEIPEKTALLRDKTWFFNWCWHQLDAVFYGYTVSQLLDKVTMEWQYIPRRNVVPQQKLMLTEVGGDTGTLWNDPAYKGTVIANVYKQEKGILNDIVSNLIWKKNARQAWAEFGEKFGIPMVFTKTNKTTKKDLDAIELMLKQLGQALTGVLPLGTEVQVIDSATKGDPFNVFLKQVELDDAAIAKRLLGGTMLLDNGSSRSQGEVHERNLMETLSLFDKKMLLGVINDQLLPLLASIGMPFAPTDKFSFDENEKLGLKDFWGIIKEAIQEGYEVEADFISKTFGFPITKKIESKPTTASFKPAPGAVHQAAAAPVAAAPGATTYMLPQYRTCCPGASTPQASAFTDLLAELGGALIDNVFAGKDTLMQQVLRAITSHRHLFSGLLDGWKDRMANLSYNATDNHCLAAMEYNIFNFSRVKEKANLFAINDLLINKETGLPRLENEFKNLARQYLKNADENWLSTEYKHCIAVGQNASRYHQFYSEKDELTAWVQWQTVGDERVRVEHRLLDDKIFNLNDPSGLTVWPPKGFGCRCEMFQYLGIPGIDQIITNEEAMTLLGLSKNDPFAINHGRAEQVFTKNQMYIQNAGLGNEINDLKYSTYKLKKFDELKKNYVSIKLDDTITSDNVSELWKPREGEAAMTFSNNNGLMLTLKKDTFDRHTADKYIKQGRHQLIPKIGEVVAEPDEVWYYKHETTGHYQVRYIKFYKEQAVVVATELGKQALEIKTWYNMAGDEAVRFGYLAYKKSQT